MNAPSVSMDSYDEIRSKTLLPHETPSLFETVAEINAADDEDEYTDEEGESVNAFASPLSLWEMKTGLYQSTPPASRSLWSRLKKGVVDAACEANGLEDRWPDGFYIDGHFGVLSARPDREVSDDGTNWYPMIAKNVAGTMAGMWRNAVGEHTPPEHIVVEAHHHMAVTNADRCYVAALFGGVTEKLFTVYRDEELVDDIIAAAASFWQCVTEKRQPKSSGPRDAAVLARINLQIDPDLPAVDKRNDSEFIKALDEKENLSKQKSKLEKRIKEITAYLNEQMQGASSAIISDERQLKWIRQPAKEMSFTKKASAHLRSSKISAQAAGTPLEDLVE